MQPNQHAFFRHFWYPVAPAELVTMEKPFGFTLLDQELALWRSPLGPVAVEDRCSHRSAKLSCGQVQDGAIVCPYHGWRFDGEGQCLHMPQQPERQAGPKHHVKHFKAQEKYGYVWVALEEPLRDPPTIAEDDDGDFRRIPCFYETWDTSAFRTMENELDMAHFSFVHTGTFGNQTSPIPLEYDLTDQGDWGLHLRAKLATVAPKEQAKNTHMPEGESSRVMEITWYLPFIMRLDISYASGLKHVIINCSTPISGDQVKVVQFHYRSDTEEEVSAEQLIAFESKIVAEDRGILEITDPSVDLWDFQAESHMPTDRAGLMMRRKLAQAIERFDGVK